jgi:hypothetical protein
MAPTIQTAIRAAAHDHVRCVDTYEENALSAFVYFAGGTGLASPEKWMVIKKPFVPL